MNETNIIDFRQVPVPESWDTELARGVQAYEDTAKRIGLYTINAISVQGALAIEDVVEVTKAAVKVIPIMESIQNGDRK